MVRFRESCQWCYQGINITWWGHELDPHWREKELKTLSPWSVPTDGEGGRLACIQSQAVVTSQRGGDSCPVSVRLTHCALIKHIPGVENSWSGCSTCLSLAPRKEQWAFFSSQVVAEAGKKQETHICSTAHSDLNSQCSVNLSFLILQDRQQPTWKVVKLAQVWTWECVGWRERILYQGHGWALGLFSAREWRWGMGELFLQDRGKCSRQLQAVLGLLCPHLLPG